MIAQVSLSATAPAFHRPPCSRYRWAMYLETTGKMSPAASSASIGRAEGATTGSASRWDMPPDLCVRLGSHLEAADLAAYACSSKAMAAMYFPAHAAGHMQLLQARLGGNTRAPDARAHSARLACRRITADEPEAAALFGERIVRFARNYGAHWQNDVLHAIAGAVAARPGPVSPPCSRLMETVREERSKVEAILLAEKFENCVLDEPLLVPERYAAWCAEVDALSPGVRAYPTSALLEAQRRIPIVARSEGLLLDGVRRIEELGADPDRSSRAAALVEALGSVRDVAAAAPLGIGHSVAVIPVYDRLVACITKELSRSGRRAAADAALATLEDLPQVAQHARRPVVLALGGALRR